MTVLHNMMRERHKTTIFSCSMTGHSRFKHDKKNSMTDNNQNPTAIQTSSCFRIRYRLSQGSLGY